MKQILIVMVIALIAQADGNKMAQKVSEKQQIEYGWSDFKNSVSGSV